MGDNNFLLWLLEAKCYNTFVVEENFFDEMCIKFFISKLLGLVIIFGALIIKVPQIINIITMHSAKGLDINSTYFELFSLGIVVAYNVQKGYNFSTYGETTFVFAQNLILVYLILYYNNKLRIFPIALVGFLGLTGLLGFVFPVWVSDLTFTYTNAPLTIISRLPQIYTNYVNRSTGALSGVTYFMQFAGAIARIFTTLHQTGDLVSLLGYSVAAFLNGVIFSQILIFGNRPIIEEKDIKKDI